MDYLNRPLVQGVRYYITNDYIKIDCDHTTWVNAKRIRKTNKDELLTLYKNVYNLAKSKNITVSRKNAYKKFIEDNWHKYEKELNQYNSLFDAMIIEFKKVQERGIHSGTVDDEVLENAIKIRNKYEEIYYRNSVYSQITEIFNTLEEIYNNLTSGANYYKIVL